MNPDDEVIEEEYTSREFYDEEEYYDNDSDDENEQIETAYNDEEDEQIGNHHERRNATTSGNRMYQSDDNEESESRVRQDVNGAASLSSSSSSSSSQNRSRSSRSNIDNASQEEEEGVVLEETVEPTPTTNPQTAIDDDTDDDNSWLGPHDERNSKTRDSVVVGINTPRRTNRRNGSSSSSSSSAAAAAAAGQAVDELRESLHANPIEGSSSNSTTSSPRSGEADQQHYQKTPSSSLLDILPPRSAMDDDNRIESRSESVEKVWTTNLLEDPASSPVIIGDPQPSADNFNNDIPEEIIEEEEEDSITRAQKQVHFEGLPENPPELTTWSSELAPRGMEENRNGEMPSSSSSSSYETDSSGSSYETDSSDSAGGADGSLVDLERQQQEQRLDEAKPRDNKMFIGPVICCAILILVAAAICLYLFSRDDDRLPVQQGISPPTIAPTTISMPTSSLAPTSYQLNDFCDDAIGPLAPGSDTRGTLAGATVDNADTCDESSVEFLPGVWYYVFGTGGEMMAHTCNNTNIDTRVSIFSGPCSNAQCLEFNDNYCGQQSAVSWNSEFLRPYFILVQGATRGPFELSIRARYNDECRDAVNLEVAPRSSTPIVMGQTIDAHPNPFICRGVTNNSPSVWYSVLGNGGDMEAVLTEADTDYNARISILTGSSCSNSICVVPRDGRGTRQVTWSSVEGINYFIIVHGEGANDVGNFGLQLRSGDGSEQRRSPW
eukprot:scaffold2189_cov116-Cylindrotheca_fusiformis.AAC.11